MDPSRERKPGRHKATWPRSVEKEIKAMSLAWGKAENGRSRQNMLEIESGGLMLRVELRAKREKNVCI